MAIVGLKVAVQGKLVRKGLEDLTAEIPKIGTSQIYKALVRSRTRLRKKASRPAYPIPWDNMRQKVKVISMLKAQGNLPYRRKGDYQKGFQIVATENGYEMQNVTETASYVGGDAEGTSQSRIYQGRYPLIRRVIEEEFEKVPPAVIQHIQLLAQEKGFGK